MTQHISSKHVAAIYCVILSTFLKMCDSLLVFAHFLFGGIHRLPTSCISTIHVAQLVRVFPHLKVLADSATANAPVKLSLQGLAAG